MSLSAYLGPRAAKPVDRPAPCTGRSPPPAMAHAAASAQESGALRQPVPTYEYGSTLVPRKSTAHAGSQAATVRWR